VKKFTASLLILSVILFSQESHAQNAKIDSLLKVLPALKADTIKANTLNNLGKEYYLLNKFDLAKKYLSEALLLSEKINYNKGKVIALNLSGSSYFSQGDYFSALEKYKPALTLGLQLDDKSLPGDSYSDIGMVYSRQGKYTEALSNYQNALKNYKVAGDQKGLTRTYSGIGNVYYEMGQFPEALQYYFLYLKIVERADDKSSMASAYTNIGMVHDNLGNSAVAMINYEKALKLYQEGDDKHGIGSCYSNIANNYYRRDSVATAIEYNKRAYKIFEEIGDRAWAAYVKNTMAQMNLNENNFKQALEDYNSSLKVFGEIGDTFNLFASYQGIAGIYYKQGLFHEAINNLHKALFMAKTIKGADNISSCYQNLIGVYDSLKDYKNAYLYYKLFAELDDSLFNEKKSAQIAEINTKYETEKKDNEIALLSKNKEIQNVEIKKQKLLKNSFVGGLGLAIVLMFLSYRTYRVRQRLRLQDIRNKIAGDLHDDIGSTLNSISIYSEVARKKDEQQDEALEMIGDASRKIIDAMSDIVWTVNPDNDSFAKIIFRMKSLAYNLFRAKKIEFTFHSDETLDDRKLTLEVRRNFYLIFKEAVNNLVKYSHATRAAITLSNENNFIRLSIKDDGMGFDTTSDSTGNGLKNMKRRADEMNAEFRIESAPGKGTQIDLFLKV
jgi:two-component system sensor histidine kinase UhpB